MQLRRTLIGVLPLLCALTMPGVADAAPGVTAIGALDRFPQEAVDAFGPAMTGDERVVTAPTGGTLLPVLGAGQLWQLYLDWGGERTGILVRDADSLRVLRTFVIDRALVRATRSPTFGGEWLHASDGGRRVFVVGGRSELLEIDTATFAVRSLGQLTALPGGVQDFFGAVPVAGLTYDHATGDLLVLYGGVAASFTANRLTVVQRIDLVTGERTNRIVRSCTGPLPQTDFGGDTLAAELLLHDDAVYLTCQKQLRSFFGPPPLDDDTRALVVKLPRATLWESDGEESSVEAGRRFNAAPVDPDGGRIAVVDLAGRATVVDVGSMSVVGTFGVSGTTQNGFGLGLDRSTGRFFFQSNLGFGYVDIRSNPPVPGAVDTSSARSGQERIQADGNKAYVLPGTALGSTKADRYTIFNAP